MELFASVWPDFLYTLSGHPMGNWILLLLFFLAKQIRLDGLKTKSYMRWQWTTMDNMTEERDTRWRDFTSYWSDQNSYFLAVGKKLGFLHVTRQVFSNSTVLLSLSKGPNCSKSLKEDPLEGKRRTTLTLYELYSSNRFPSVRKRKNWAKGYSQRGSIMARHRSYADLTTCEPPNWTQHINLPNVQTRTRKGGSWCTSKSS